MKEFLYCLVFPHPLNNHRARILHHKSLFIIIGILIFSSFFFPSSLNPIGDKIKAFAQISARELFSLTNQKRVENGLSPLSENSQLEEAASKKAEDMLNKGYWAHTAPDGTTPWVFIKQAGYDYVYAGENLARGFTSANNVVDAWMASPQHRVNILSPNFTDVGFAIEEGKLDGVDTFLVVQEFGSRNVPVPQVSSTSSPPSFAGSLDFPSLSKSSQIAILLMSSLILLLVIDMIVVRRKGVIRIVGHNLDHALFLIMVIFIIILIGKSSVL